MSVANEDQSRKSFDDSAQTEEQSKCPTTPVGPEQQARKVSFEEGTPTATPENVQPKLKAQSTPAVVKVRKTRQEFHVQSPSDAVLSPCTQKLFGPGRRKAPNTSHALSVLRSKQQAKLNLDQSMDADD